jgi:hypothetical protein
VAAQLPFDFTRDSKLVETESRVLFQNFHSSGNFQVTPLQALLPPQLLSFICVWA